MSRTLNAAVAILWGAALVAPAPSHACSTFLLRHDTHLVFGNNYDWDVADGLVIVNKRGVEKRAEADTLGAQWTSHYGSVTFNQYGREMPHGGMNERGLTIGLMWLSETKCPEVDSRAAVGELEWIQYMLDNCATVAEVLATDSVLRIRPRAPAPVHYFVCDTTGASAAVEMLRGRMVAHTGERMPVPVLTNNTYEEGLGALRSYAHSGRAAIPGVSSLARFMRAGALLDRSRPPSAAQAVDQAFAILDSISMGSGTAWTIVGDLVSRRLYFRTVRRTRVRSVGLAEFDFSCSTPVVVLNMNAGGKGDVSGAFAAYTSDANLRLMQRTFSRTDFLASMSQEQIEFNARIPETHTRCAEGQ